MGGRSVLKRVLEKSGTCRAEGRKAISIGVVLILSAGVAPAGASGSGNPGDDRGRYLVVLRNSSNSARQVAAEHTQRHGAEVSHVYQHALKGYAAELPEQALQGISRDPRVAFIEPDRTIEVTSQTVPTGVKRVYAPSNPTIDIDATDDVRVDVDVAILDTGLSAHPDLNVASLADCSGGGSVGLCVSEAGIDDNGHGTHVAGTAAALDNDWGVVGVAPGARLHGVKVLSATGSGLLSWAVAGIDWITERSDVIEVANMSLGCECKSVTLDQAIANSVDKGIVYAVAAGNSEADATDFSPARHPDVITVSALADFDGAPGGSGATSCRTDVDDTLADFSNWGSAVEVAAPGVCILSTSLHDGYRTMSGTSMASPHVAGAAAVLASGANDPQDRADVGAVRNLITGSGTFDWIDDSGDGSQEPLLNVGNPDVFVANSGDRTLGTSPSPSPSPTAGNQTPVAEFAYSCSKLTCSFDATSSSDPDGTVSSYTWDFGDGTTASGMTVEKTYASSNTYTVRLDVVDDGGATSTTSKTFEVTDGADESRITLNASGSRTSGSTTIVLQWYGTDGVGTVVVYRNGEPVATTEDDGAYTETIAGSSGSLTYKVCEERTTRCSNEAKLF